MVVINAFDNQTLNELCMAAWLFINQSKWVQVHKFMQQCDMEGLENIKCDYYDVTIT